MKTWAQRFMARGGAIALRHGDETVSFVALAEQSARFAGGLRRLGIGRGDVFTACLPNVPQWFYLLFGAETVGALMLPLSTRLRVKELTHFVGVSRSRVLVIPSAFLGIDFEGMAQEIRASVPTLECVVQLHPDGTCEGMDLDGTESGGEGNAEALALCAFTTSGTTGNPKLAVHDQRSVLMHAERVARTFDIRVGDAIFCALPLSGAIGFAAGSAALAAGASCVLDPTFDAERVPAHFRRFGVTHWFGADAMLREVLDLNSEPDDFARWRGGGFANFTGRGVEMFLEAEARWSVRLVGIYGSSECFALMGAGLIGASVDERLAAGGVPIDPGIEIRVVSLANGMPVGDGESGELQVRGYNVMTGYLNNPAATAKAFTADGWFRTGDLARCHGARFVYLARLNDSLRLAGYLVEPGEIEESIKEHAAVDSCHVVGCPDAASGEDVAVAFVRLKPNAPTAAAEILKFCAGRVAKYKVPRRLLLLDEFPTVTGPNGTKISKVRLRELAARALANK